MDINQIKTQRILSPTQIDLGNYVINPYRGCEIGCIYCYSQENKNVRKRKKDWGRFLDVKINSPEILKAELEKISPERILIGSTTECFQPEEKHFGITKSILEILRERKIPIVILTKSPLIKDYIPLISYHKKNKIYFTFIFSDPEIKCVLEPKSSSLSARAEAIEELLKNNIKVKIHIGPYIPYLEDLENLFELIPKKIEETEIEFYNAKMGSLDRILKTVEAKISKDKAEKIKEVYSSEENYKRFSNGIINKAERINSAYGFKLNFIVPDYDLWYTDKIKYE